MTTPLAQVNRAKVKCDEARATALLTEDDLDNAARDIVNQVLSRFIGLKRQVRARGKDLESALKGEAS